jgi:glucans biosynthesis protein C
MMSVPQKQAPARMTGMDFVRISALFGVILYHACGAYATNTPYWGVHDGSSAVATGIRELVDVFIMPLFFFLAGYFTLGSLRKKGYWTFFKGKFWELGYVWLVVVILVLPFILWFTDLKAGRPGMDGGFLSYWLGWLGGIGQTRLGLFENPAQSVHAHFWFISLLFYFFLVFLVLRKAWSKLRGAASNPAKVESLSGKKTMPVLLGFGLVIAAGYFLSLLLVPDTSWLTVKLFVQFQPAKLFIFAGYFGLGLYGYSRNWFLDGRPLGRLSIWGPVTVLLAVAFMFVGLGTFQNPSTTQTLPPAYLLLYALVRSFLLLAVLVTFCSLGMKFFNRPNRFINTMADNSYYIYLVHILFINVFQDVLEIWPNGPIEIKIVIVWALSLAFSYPISRWIFKKVPRWWGLLIMIALFFALPLALTAVRQMSR